MHLPFRKSRSPVLRALLRALERGLSALRLREAVATMYLDSAHGPWLDRYAALYAYARRPGEGDDALRARMYTWTILERMKTTDEAIVRSVRDACGVSAQIIPSHDLVAEFDDLEGMANGESPLDYSRLDREGNESFDTAAHGVGGPWSPGYGPSGLLIRVAAPWSPELEHAVALAVRDCVPAASGFDLLWLKHLDAQWTDQVGVSDAGARCYPGWGLGPWDSEPWGSECEPFGVVGWDIEPYAGNWGSWITPPRRRADALKDGSITP